MRSIAFFFCFLAAARLSVLCAPIQSQHAAVVARKNAGGPPVFAYPFTETFEGSNSGYDQAGWTTTGTTPNPDAASPTGMTSQSLLIGTGSSVAGSSKITLPSDQNEIWVRFKYHPLALASKTIFYLENSANTVIWSVTQNADGRMITTGAAAYTVSTVSTGNTYNVWAHFRLGTGNAVTSVAFSSGTTEPVSGNDFTAKTNGTITTQVNELFFGWSGNAAYQFYIDDVTISTSSIGDF